MPSKIDQVTLDRIQLLHPMLRDEAYYIYTAQVVPALSGRAMCRFAFTLRSWEEQAALYAQGRTKLFDSKGRLLRRFREAESKYNAYLTDYSELALANLFLYFGSFDISYIEKAAKLCEDTIKLFQAPSGAFFDTGSDAEQLIRRSIDGYDGVEPSGNSTISFVLNYLASLGIETSRYESLSEKIFKFFAEDLSKRAVSYPFMLKSYHYATSIKKQIVVTGNRENLEVQTILSYLKTNFLPNVLVCYHDGNSENERILPILKNKFSEDCKIYVCENQTCALPIHTLDELRLAFGK